MRQEDRRILKTVADRLGTARRAAGLTLRELAERANTSHSTLHAYEHCNKAVSITTLVRILEAAGFDAEIRIRPRVTEAGSLDRGEEIEQVLLLAGMYPSNPDMNKTLPVMANLMTKAEVAR